MSKCDKCDKCRKPALITRPEADGEHHLCLDHCWTGFVAKPNPINYRMTEFFIRKERER